MRVFGVMQRSLAARRAEDDLWVCRKAGMMAAFMGDEAENPPGGNRRKHPRTALSLLVQYRFDTFEEFLSEYASNISLGGMFIRTEEPREVGQLVYIQFWLKDGSKLIEGLGKVVRVNSPNDSDRVVGMGIEFVNFDPESMELIEEICGSRAAQLKPKN